MGEELDQYDLGDELIIDGELFTVTDIQEDLAVLTPLNENGHAKLDWSKMDNRYVFRRAKGIDPSEVSILP